MGAGILLISLLFLQEAVAPAECEGESCAADAAQQQLVEELPTHVWEARRPGARGAAQTDVALREVSYVPDEFPPLMEDASLAASSILSSHTGVKRFPRDGYR